jgi:polyhydroxybutyrate depolymerase
MAIRMLTAAGFILLAQPILADEPRLAKSATNLRARSVSVDLKRMEWKIGEATREALVYVPEASKDAPLVFVWHGHGGTMKHASASFALHKLWPEAIVVYPQGLPTSGKIVDPEGKLPGWQFNPGENEDRDLKFFDAMLESFKRDLKADPKRVFVTGHSNGGRFVYLLWATRAEAIAAFAPSASPANGLLARMKPKPCLHIAGESDRLVPFAGQQRTIDRVRQINGCEAEGQRWGDFGGKVTLYTSRDKTPVVSAFYPGGHEFPKEAPELIVKFFKLRDRE